MDFVVFTDHDTITAHKNKPDDQICAFELSVHDPNIGFEVHINIYEVTKKDFTYLIKHNTDIKKILSYCKKHDLPHTYNHPFWFAKNDHSFIIQNPKHVYESIQYLAKHIDVIEINHSRPKYQNIMAYKLAKKHDKALIIGTDTHVGNIASAYTLAQGNTFREWFMNVKNHNAILYQETTSEWLFDNEAHKYMKYLMKLPSGKVILETDNSLADWIITLNNTSRRLSKIINPLLWPAVSIATKTGIARKWYFHMQKSYTKNLTHYL
jgi:predicted metal-dependent phosphoesterase TrpH